jgi:hypothetical protein
MNCNCTRLNSLSALLIAGLLLLPSAALHANDSTKNETTTLAGSLVDNAGQPIRGAKLTVFDVWKQVQGHLELAPGSGSGISDAAGQIKIEHLPADRILSLRFSHPDFPRYWFEASTAKDAWLARKLPLCEIVGNNFRKVFDRPQNVSIKLVGNDGKTPVPGVVLKGRPAPGSEPICFSRPEWEWSAIGRTDQAGFVKLLLPAGFHELALGNDRPLDCIGLNEKELCVRDVAHSQTFLRMTRRGTDVTFRAIDADSRQPIAGVSFWREMPAGEYWFDVVRNENVGSDFKPISEDDARKPPYVTDKDGLYRCQMGATRGWTYHVHHCPEGYVEVDARGQTFDIPEEGTVDRTFYLRKRVKEKPKAD